MPPVLLAPLLVALAAAPPQPAPLGGELALRRTLHAASVELATGCSGVLAESRQLVVTALHCVDGGRQNVRVRFSTGTFRTAWVAATDEASDQAVLFLEDPVPIEPLTLVRRRQIPGTVLYFEGHPEHPRFQSARLEKVGRCSSLPDLPNALFTSIQGKPGDSGAPLVDAAARVAGLVHGGARCHIATPADTLLRLIDEILGRDAVQMTRALPRPATPRASASRAGASSRTAPRA
jgi:S1-C subfamily serine protease